MVALSDDIVIEVCALWRGCASSRPRQESEGYLILQHDYYVFLSFLPLGYQPHNLLPCRNILSWDRDS